MIKHERLRAINKRVLNPQILKFAGKTPGPLGVVQHIGRRSGKSYKTPIMVERIKGGFLIALTYGADVDWYRNVMAAGGGVLRWHNRKYAIAKPEPVDASKAMQRFPLPMRAILRLNNTEDFVQVRSRAVEFA